jgi:hypothetical protein
MYIIANIHDIYETTTQEGAGGGLGRQGNIDIMRLPNRVIFWAVVLSHYRFGAIRKEKKRTHVSSQLGDPCKTRTSHIKRMCGFVRASDY